MSIADCPNFPQCGHRAMSECDADMLGERSSHPAIAQPVQPADAHQQGPVEWQFFGGTLWTSATEQRCQLMAARGIKVRALYTHPAPPLPQPGQDPTAWFAFADHNGPVPLELYGWDEKACKHAVLTYARAGNWKGTVEGYLMHEGWTLRPVYTGPPHRQPLTTKVAMKLLAALLNILECDEDDHIPSDLAEEARAALEAAHGIEAVI